MPSVAFLPGAGGRREFWAPVADRLELHGHSTLIGWPGFGDEPRDPRIHALTDLVDYCIERIEGPVDIVAQSMGGVVAMLLALRRPDLISRLVLCATSGGIDLSAFKTEDWRENYIKEMPPTTPMWFVHDRTNVEDQLPGITSPTLLIWGAEDRIVPPEVGKHLAGRLTDAKLIVVDGAGHAVGHQKPAEVASHIASFLTAGAKTA